MASEQDRKMSSIAIQREELRSTDQRSRRYPESHRIGEGNRRIYLELVFATRDQARCVRKSVLSASKCRGHYLMAGATACR